MRHDDLAAGVYVETEDFEVSSEGAGGSEPSLRSSHGDLPAGSGEAIRTGLRQAGFEIASVLVFATGPSMRRGGEGSRLSVELAPGEDAAVLVESAGGIHSWRTPDAREEAAPGTRSGDPGSARAVFHLDRWNEAPAEEPGRRAWPTSWAVGRVLDPIRTYVLRFVVRKALNRAVDWLEGDAVVGPVAIGGAAIEPPSGDLPGSWTPAPVTQGDGEGARRVLLLVHGTFSSTAASFGQLRATDEGRDFLARAEGAYDLILGFDHKTLARTPAENAQEILETLLALRLHPECVIDSIAFSRGGLVYRALAEQLLSESGLRASLGKAIFVGCTNSGTNLARPANWARLADIYTNIAVAAVGGVGLVLGGGPATMIVSQTIKTVGRLVQLMSEVAIGERYVPGLAAMEPGGAFISVLNDPGRLIRQPARYYAISSSFEPSRGAARGFTADLGRFLADRLSDRLFGGENDLVVDTASMTDFGPDRRWIEEGDGFSFGETADVYHTIYFADPRVASRLTHWLAPAPRETKALRGEALDWDDGFAFGPGGSIPYRHVSLDDRRGPGGIGDVDRGEADPQSDERHIAAEMQQYPRLGAPANVFVTLSAAPLQSAGHDAAAATEAGVEVERGTPVDIEIVPVANCRVLGDARRSFFVEDKDQTFRFMVEGVAVGPAKLLVEARQRAATIASFLLRPDFVAADSRVIRAGQPALPATPAEQQGLIVLRIYEYREGNRLRSLRFDLQGSNPDVAVFDLQEVEAGIDLDGYLRQIYAAAERAWNLRGSGDDDRIYRAFLMHFSDEAKTRTEALLPREIRDLLWKHRHAIGAIQVISENPTIPWELMYVSDPSGQSDEEGGFFAEWGLVRWLHGVRIPGPTLSLDGARGRYVIPAYRGGGVRPLPGAEQEKAMLARKLGDVSEIEADSLEVVRFIKQARDCDVLHFACHGRAGADTILRSELLMRGIDRDGQIFPDSLTVDQVRQNLRFGQGVPRALVFLNACQAGQTGYGLTGASGFADAFIRPVSGQGAAAFVGALWSIDDRQAVTFAEALYGALLQGETLIGAVKAARVACQTRSDLSWLAYTVYGNPYARVDPGTDDSRTGPLSVAAGPWP